MKYLIIVCCFYVFFFSQQRKDMIMYVFTFKYESLYFCDIHTKILSDERRVKF